MNTEINHRRDKKVHRGGAASLHRAALSFAAWPRRTQGGGARLQNRKEGLRPAQNSLLQRRRQPRSPSQQAQQISHLRGAIPRVVELRNQTMPTSRESSLATVTRKRTRAASLHVATTIWAVLSAPLPGLQTTRGTFSRGKALRKSKKSPTN